jgi:hypothetical protein
VGNGGGHQQGNNEDEKRKVINATSSLIPSMSKSSTGSTDGPTRKHSALSWPQIRLVTQVQVGWSCEVVRGDEKTSIGAVLGSFIPNYYLHSWVIGDCSCAVVAMSSKVGGVGSSRSEPGTQ